MKLKINGQTHEVEVAPEMPLLWILRDKLRLTGTKFGCGIAQCGACMVQIDGRARLACVTPAIAAEGAEIRTIEGLEGPAAEAVQSAWIDLDVPQCGYCQSGQIISAVALLENVPSPSDEEIEQAMMGNLCRCNCYSRIRQAVKDAADQTGGEA
jgi:isoquinoline 1-oxidoreductase alpha subunit